MNRVILQLAAVSAAFGAAPAIAADTLLPVPATLMNKAGVVCFKINPNGTVKDAFLVTSTGDDRADGDMIDYARQIRWPAAAEGDPSRSRWVPLPVVMGQAARPAVPDRCAPPLARR